MSASEDLLPNVVQAFEFDDDSLPSLEPYEFQLHEALSQPYRLQLSLVARDPSIDESELVGHAGTLTLTRAGLVRHINGIVTEATFSGIALDAMTPQGNLPHGLIHLTIVPAFELLKQRRNNRIFQNVTVTDVLEQVLNEALGDYGRQVTMKTSSGYELLEYCTQYDESDFEFVQRLMATEGIMSYFFQDEKKEELILFDDADKYQKLVTVDHGKVPFETHFQEGHSVETVRKLTMNTKLTATAATVRAFNWSKTSGAPDETPSDGKDSLDRTRELYHGESPVSLQQLGDDGVYAQTSAQVQAELIKAAALARTTILRGDSDVSGLSPGVTFELDNALRDDLNQEYLVIEATHRGVRPGDRRQGTFNAELGEVMYTNTFKCVPSDVLYLLERPARRFVQTMQTALVVGDDDITTDVHGRIKVQFHWDREGQNDIKSSCWVRVAQASAGIGFGCVFIPRKGQEVVVSFLEGDPDRPLVVGSVYNAVNTPPYTLDDHKTRSVIRTRSTPDSDGYNEISFEDTRDSEQLFVQAQKNMDEVVKNNHTLTIGNNETLRVGDDSKGGKTEDGNRTRWVKNNESIEVGGNRTHTVKKDENITVNGNQTITIKGGGQSAVHSAVSVTGKHTFDATDTIKIQAPTSITFECGGSTIVMEPGKITMTAGGQAVMVLDSDVAASSPKGGNLKLDDKVAASSMMGSALQLDMDAALSGTMKAAVSGNLEATMSAAAASVKSSPTGVDVNGPQVNVSGIAMVNVSAVMVKIN